MTKTKLSASDKENILFAVQQIEFIERNLNKCLGYFVETKNKEFMLLIQSTLNNPAFSSQKLKSLLWTVINTNHKNYIDNTLVYFFNSSKQFPYWWRNYNILKTKPNPIYVFFVYKDIHKHGLLVSLYKSLQFYLSGAKML